MLHPFPLDQACCSSFIVAPPSSPPIFRALQRQMGGRKGGRKVPMKKLTLLLSSFFFLVAACSPRATATPQSTEPQTLTIMRLDSFAVSEAVVKSFEQANNAKIVFLQSGDAGAVLNKAILTKDAPLADLLYGVDNTFLSRALEANIFEEYASPELRNIPDAFKLDASNRALPVDYGDVCINYDKAYFADKNVAAPQSLEDLTK